MAKTLRKDELTNPPEEQERPRLNLARQEEEVDSGWKTAIDEVELSPEEMALAEAGAETQEIPPGLLEEDDDLLTPEEDLRKLLSGDKNSQQKEKESRKMATPSNGTSTPPQTFQNGSGKGEKLPDTSSVIRLDVASVTAGKKRRAEIRDTIRKLKEEDERILENERRVREKFLDLRAIVDQGLAELGPDDEGGTQ